MAREAKGWEALCFAAATEKDPDKLQEIIVDLNVLLETRQEELEKRRSFDSAPPRDSLGRWHN
jgi:hypothetical protein